MDLLPGLWINKTRQVVILIRWVLIDANWLQNNLQTNNNIKTNLNHKLQITVNENKLINAYLQSNYLFNKLSNLWNEQNELKMQPNIWDHFTLLFFSFWFLVFFLSFFYMSENNKRTERQINKKKKKKKRLETEIWKIKCKYILYSFEALLVSLLGWIWEIELEVFWSDKS
jgi:ATP-dependent Zn protease